MPAITDYPGSAVLPKAAASSRRRTVTYWAVRLPFLAETALGIQWDLQRGEYVRGLLDKIRFPYYFHTTLGVSKVLALAALLVPGFPRLKGVGLRWHNLRLCWGRRQPHCTPYPSRGCARLLGSASAVPPRPRAP